MQETDRTERSPAMAALEFLALEFSIALNFFDRAEFFRSRGRARERPKWISGNGGRSRCPRTVSLCDPRAIGPVATPSPPGVLSGFARSRWDRQPTGLSSDLTQRPRQVPRPPAGQLRRGYLWQDSGSIGGDEVYISLSIPLKARKGPPPGRRPASRPEPQRGPQRGPFPAIAPPPLPDFPIRHAALWGLVLTGAILAGAILAGAVLPGIALTGAAPADAAPADTVRTDVLPAGVPRTGNDPDGCGPNGCGPNGGNARRTTHEE